MDKDAKLDFGDLSINCRSLLVFLSWVSTSLNESWETIAWIVVAIFFFEMKNPARLLTGRIKSTSSIFSFHILYKILFFNKE